MLIRSAEILNFETTDLATLMAVAEHESDAVTVTDRKGTMIYVNPAFEILTGFSKEWAIGCPASLLNAGLTPRETFSELWAKLESGRVVRCEFVNRRRDGGIYQESKIIRPLFDALGTITHYVSQGWRSEGSQDLIERLTFLALHDPLTLLPNRNYFLETGHRELALADRSGQGLAVCFVDLDRLKGINDVFGHRAGDEVLRHFARSIRSRLREVDFMARMGGDEFAILLWNVTKRSDVSVILNRLLAPLEPSTRADFHRVSVSGGVALSSEIGMDLSGLLQAADEAMYRVKSKGGAGYAFAERKACRNPSHQGWHHRPRQAHLSHHSSGIEGFGAQGGVP